MSCMRHVFVLCMTWHCLLMVSQTQARFINLKTLPLFVISTLYLKFINFQKMQLCFIVLTIQISLQIPNFTGSMLGLIQVSLFALYPSGGTRKYDMGGSGSIIWGTGWRRSIWFVTVAFHQLHLLPFSTHHIMGQERNFLDINRCRWGVHVQTLL